MDKNFLAFDDHIEHWPTPVRLRFQVVQEGGEIRQGFVYASNERILAEIVRELFLAENGGYIVVRLEKGRKGE